MSNGLKLYPHNIRAYSEIKQVYQDGQNIVGVVHATGTGKSYIALSLCLDNNDLKTIYLVPSLAVMNHIKKIISESKLDLKKDFANLQFRTYQSLCNLSTTELHDISPELLIVDEFHHLGAPIWGNRIKEIINNNPNIKIFGMTAYTIRDRGTIYERDMANPNGKELFSNKIVSNYDLADAMIEGVLPIPIYRSAYSYLEGIAKELEEKVQNNISNIEEQKEYMRILGAVKKRIHEAPKDKDLIQRNIKPNGKYIYFCPPGSVEGINDIDTIMNEVRVWLKDYDVEFYQTTSELGEFGFANQDAFYNDVDLKGNSVKNKIKIMFAINQYNEGVHAPNIDGVILGRGTSSDIVYFEQIGRALSVKGNTYEEFNKYLKYSYEELCNIAKSRDIDFSKLKSKEDIIERIVAPVIIDLANNVTFIKQLENNIQDRIRTIRENKHCNNYRNVVIQNVSFDIDVLNEDLYQVLINLRDRLNNFTWERNYKLAEDYYKQNGNLKILRNYEIKSNGQTVKLGEWIHYQRKLYKNETLSSDKIERLNNISMIWNQIDFWDVYYMYAKQYYDEHGNLDIPALFEIKSGDNTFRIGHWIIRQRAKYKNGELEKEKIKKLENIGMIWIKYNFLKWDQYYELAKEYYLKHGNLQIKSTYKTEFNSSIVNLGQWIDRQRRFYESNKLSEEKIIKLENIGIVWKIKKNPSWEEMFEFARDYYNKHGNLKIPLKYQIENYKLGSWIATQRVFYKKNKLNEAKIEKLNSIGMIWNASLSIGWEEIYKLAAKYYEQYGNLSIPYNYTIKYTEEITINLGLWINNQRNSYKMKNLSDDRIKKLEMLGIDWHIHLEWEEIFRLAEAYFVKNKNLNIPLNYRVIYDNQEILLGAWIKRQRILYQTNKLSEDKIEKLESIGIVWNPENDKISWDDMYLYAKEYYKKNGNLKISLNFEFQDNNRVIKLGQWIGSQRNFYQRNMLKKDKIEKLDSIGMIWNVFKNCDDIENLCNEFQINYKKYKDKLITIPIKVLFAKFKYLQDNNMPIIIDDKLHPVITMSELNMQVNYNIGLSELIEKYGKESKMGK